MADESLDMITHLLGTEAAADTVINFFFFKKPQSQPQELPHLILLWLLAAL